VNLKRSHFVHVIIITCFLLFTVISRFYCYRTGIEAGRAFVSIFVEMFKVMPCAFILIGLFEVWVKRETVIRHMGENSGIRGYIWMLLLAGLSVGGLLVAFPIAQTLYRKGASLKTVFIYLGFVGVFRIPMTVFEISFLGLPFTLLRLAVALPLFLLVGTIMGTVLSKRDYTLNPEE